MLANATRRGYSITLTLPSRRLMFIWGLVVSASAKSIMFEWFGYILRFLGVDSHLREPARKTDYGTIIGLLTKFQEYRTNTDVLERRNSISVYIVLHWSWTYLTEWNVENDLSQVQVVSCCEDDWSENSQPDHRLQTLHIYPFVPVHARVLWLFWLPPEQRDLAQKATASVISDNLWRWRILWFMTL